ncbi:MAG: dipeptidyl aminopeptidase [Ignavibacteriae bacterium]|nr:MAG: dipeptidyl aminopeptidase [Ignavibacteriota bacterium]
MKKFFLFFLITILTLNMKAQNKRAITVEDLWNMERIGSYNVSPDGSKIIFDLTVYSMEENKGETSVWIINSDGSSQKKLLDDASVLQFSKDGKKFFFKKDKQVYSCDLEGNNQKQITDFYSGVNCSEFSNDESEILFSSMVYPECTTQDCNKKKDKEKEESKVKAEIFTELMYRHWNDWRGPKISHLFLYDIKTNKYIDLNLNSKSDVPPLALGSSNDFSFSPTSSEIAFATNESDFIATSTDNNIFLMRLSDVNENGKTPYQKISISEGSDVQPVFSPNGKYIAYCSMERAGFEADKQRIMLYNLITKKTTNITADYDFSAGEIIWSNDSKAIYFTAANKIYNSIFKIEIETQLLSTIVEKVVASSIKLSQDGETLFFKNQKSTMPNEIFSIKTTKTDFKKITDVNGKLLAQLDMNEVETFWTKGAGDVEVQSILVKPPFFDEKKKYPMMFLIHGGPQGHWEDDFHYRWNLQMFAAKGYVVVAPNPRGSTGYGQKFTDDISKDWGGKVYTDLMNSYDYAVNNISYIDKNNTFASGASYGGYMINWIEGHTDRFNALICHAGVFNLTSMYGTTEELWFPEWENGGTPWENRAAYEKWSPHMYVENFKTPMLVIHGAYDFRVPFGQAMELFTTLQKMGVESKMLYFPDETHFVVKPQNARLWWNTIYNWLGQHIKK